MSSWNSPLPESGRGEFSLTFVGLGQHKNTKTKKDKIFCRAKATSGNQITSGTATVAEVILVPWCWLLLEKKEVKARVVQTRIDVSRNEIWNFFFGVRATEGRTKRNTYIVAWQRRKNTYTEPRAKVAPENENTAEFFAAPCGRPAFFFIINLF